MELMSNVAANTINSNNTGCTSEAAIVTLAASSPTQLTPVNLIELQTAGRSNKRVSFDEHRVKTFVYDKEATNDGCSSDLSSHIKLPFTGPDAPPSRITVVAEESEMPTTIMPPTQFEDTQNVSAVSPPLPALVKKMGNEAENPFRPEEILFHEVDPIVEAYKRKPYPPSLDSSPNTSPIKSPNQAYLNGISPSSLVADTKVEKVVTDTTPLTSSVANDDGADDDDYDHEDVEFQKARQVECVRIEKRKCGCCTVQ